MPGFGHAAYRHDAERVMMDAAVMNAVFVAAIEGFRVA